MNAYKRKGETSECSLKRNPPEFHGLLPDSRVFFPLPKISRKVLEVLFATASILGSTDGETPRQSASSKHLSVSLSFPPVKRYRSSRKRNPCCSLIRLAVADQTNSHVVPVGQDGGRDSRPAGCALRSDTGGGGGGEGADPSGGTHPGGTRKRAEHGGGTVSAIYDGIERGSGVFDHRRGMGRSSGEITFFWRSKSREKGHT